jgi:hypothetical protein
MCIPPGRILGTPLPISSRIHNFLLILGDAEIVKFLSEEIATERKNQKTLPSLSGWEVKTEGAEVTMTRPGPGGEKVVVTLNVNHTVDSAEPDDGQGEVRFVVNDCFSSTH